MERPAWVMRQLASKIQSRSYTIAGLDIPAKKQKYIPSAGKFPAGFQVAGVNVGVKPNNTTKPDIALITSDRPCAAAAVFTKNKFQAAPVTFSRDLLKKTNNKVQSVIINSGCANAVTGKGGLEDAVKMSQETDKITGTSDSTIVMSTGVIGQRYDPLRLVKATFGVVSFTCHAQLEIMTVSAMRILTDLVYRLPLQKILGGIPKAQQALGSSHEHWMTTATAICTTDTFPKLISREFRLPSSPDKTYHIAGMTKGAGMIHPNMATLLGVICTDAPVSSTVIPALLKSAVDRSFNSITIDGDTSTNDTVALLANGAAGGQEITSEQSEDYEAFRQVLSTTATDLAKLIVRDGEGATKFVTIRVTEASSETGARKIASTIARSPLVKTALYGRDANWGRILCATGYSLLSEPGEAVNDVAEIIAEKTNVSFVPTDGSAELKLLVNGEPEAVDEARASEILQVEDLEILVRLGTGKEAATYWTCDYSHEYITINGDYRT